MSDLVSIVIPNYKRVNELKKALDSVLEQTYSNLEILIIDDNSPNFDEINKIVASYQDKRITLYKHNKNKGGGAARNTGIKNSTGKYIAFLDSDDTWNNTKIEKQLNLANSHPNVLIYCKSKIFTNKKKIVLPRKSIKEKQKFTDYLFVNNGFMQTSSIFISTDIAKKCLFDETLKRHQDYDFLLKVEKEKPLILMNEEILTTIYWNSGIGFSEKGWTPSVSFEFLNLHKDSFSKKSYSMFYFNTIISYTASYFSKKKALYYLYKEIWILRNISFKLFFNFFVRLLFDWRYYLKRNKN